MARATSSLPVPVSPWRNTGPSLESCCAIRIPSSTRATELGTIAVNTTTQYSVFPYLPPAGKSAGSQVTFSLEQNYPNPFNPDTEIRYQVVTPGPVSLTVYNSLGQVVRRLAEGHGEAGRYVVRWNGRDDAGRSVSSGVYYYHLQSGGLVITRQATLVK